MKKPIKNPKHAGKLLDNPIAITSGGQLLLNVTHLDGMFVGVAAPKQLRRELRRDIDDAAADVVGRLGPRLRRRRPR